MKSLFFCHLPDQPLSDPDQPFTVHSLIVGWLNVIMIPAAAVLCWSQSTFTLGWGGLLSLVGPPAVAILQGAAGMLYYRAHFGDSPHPITPAHGVVIVNPKDNNSDEKQQQQQQQPPRHCRCSCQSGQRWRCTPYPSLSSSDRTVLDKARADPPLRMLVIGDSLALGVGTERSCTPMLPEIIARTISKHLHGKAVFWTSHGFPGANAAWVVRELQRGVQYEGGEQTGGGKREQEKEKNDDEEEEEHTPELELLASGYSSSSASDSASEQDENDVDIDEMMAAEAAGTIASSTTPISSHETNHDGHNNNNYNDDDYSQWRRDLKEHSKRFDPIATGPYDIVVVMTAANDLKAAVFPFLLQGEDSEFRQQARKRGGSYRIELERLLETLSPLMNTRFGDADTIRSNLTTRPCQPLVVFPGMPADVLPCFRKYPLRFLSVPVVGLMDNHKRAVSRTYPGQVLYLSPPPLAEIEKYEGQTGERWQRRVEEDTLLSLREVSEDECRRTETSMRDYYRNKSTQYRDAKHHRIYYNDEKEEEEEVVTQLNVPVPKLSERPGRPGTRIFCLDGVHPNDEGYDYWGRYIGDGIVQSWKEQQHQQQKAI